MNSKKLTEAGEQLFLVVKVLDDLPLEEMISALDKGVVVDSIVSDMFDPSKNTTLLLKRLVRSFMNLKVRLVKIKKQYGRK